MNTILKTLCACALTSLLISCQPDDPKDKQSPTVSFVQQDEAVFSGVVELSFKIADNSSISSIDLFVDEILIANKSVKIDSGTVKISWDSKGVADGKHDLRVVVKDNSGNETEQKFQVTVVNEVLLTVTVGNSFTPDTENWIFLSDLGGQCLGVQQAFNNSTLTFYNTEDYRIDSLQVTVFTHFSFPESRDYARTYIYVPKANLTLGELNQAEEDHGAVLVTVTNLEPGKAVQWESADRYQGYTSATSLSDTYTISQHLKADKANMIVAVQDGDSLYYKFITDLHVGDSVGIDYHDFIPMNAYKFTMPGAAKTFHFDVGYMENEQDWRGYLYGLNYLLDTDEATSYSPAESIFSKYISVSIAYYQDGSSDYYQTYSTQPHTMYKKLNTTIDDHQFDDRSIALTLSGDGGMVSVEMLNDKEDGWTYFTRYNQYTSFPKMRIPEVLIEKYLQSDTIFTVNACTINQRTIPGNYYLSIVNNTFFGGTNSSEDYEFLGKRVLFDTPASGRKGRRVETPQSIVDLYKGR